MKPSTRKRPPRQTAPLPAPGSITYHKPFTDMSRQEAYLWIEGLRARLLTKKARERAYLDRRAGRGTHTPTDDAYEADQILEEEILLVLGDLAKGLREEGSP